MIVRVFDEERANTCDKLLTDLIQDERKYDDSIDKNFIVKDYFKNIIKNKDNILLCYEEDKTIKGYIFLKPIESDNKKGYLIDGLYVMEKYRNKGIATKLLKESMSILNNMKIDFIDINVMANNKAAIKIYSSLGFNEFRIMLRKNI